MEKTTAKGRIWEIDFLRGALIPGMVMIHLLFDLVYLYGLVPWQMPSGYWLFSNNYGAAFVLLSGVSVTLGHRSVRRGFVVFAGGLLCTAVTWGMYILGLSGQGIIIYFGVLHCLGVCMMLWPLFRGWKPWQLAILGVVLTLAGWAVRCRTLVDFPWLIPLGIRNAGFSSSDYYPLMPNLGYFLLGAAAGRTLYREKKSLFPDFPCEQPLVRMFRSWGRNSLMIYLVHQPLLAGLCELLVLLKKVVNP